jgi:3-phosphoshikimate 1-carboxyvinyltransferase
VAIQEGTAIPARGRDLRYRGTGLRGLTAAPGVLDAGNSGSTIRMLAGILAAHPFPTSVTGDDSLRRRPMRRIIVPLERMGARVTSDDGRPPLTIEGTSQLAPSTFEPEVPSAQVKSAVLLAGCMHEA